jgi:DnaJ-class molecular chaperone
MPETVFKVIKETWAWIACQNCKGAGVKTSTFRGQKFTNTCSRCGGTRREKKVHRTEVPLVEALKELGTARAYGESD